MNLNKELCKRYDKHGKGYVEIWDILPTLFNVGIIISIGIFLLNGARLFISPFFNNSIEITNPVLATLFETISLMCFVCGCVIIVACIVFIIVYYVCSTVIAKCEK
jgi:hypothetical protein